MKALQALLGVGLFFLLASAPIVAQSTGPNIPAFNLPFQHVIVVIQENRTPTNLFGGNEALRDAGAHLPKTGQCLTSSGGTSPVTLTQAQLDVCFDPDHFHQSAWVPTYNAGAMNGACEISGGVKSGCSVPACPVPTQSGFCPEYTFVNPAQLGPYFQLAAQYGFANYMFQTNQGPSFPAHQFLFSGTSAPTKPLNDFYNWFAADNIKNNQTLKSPYGCLAKSGAIVQEVNPTDGSESPGFEGGYPCYQHDTLLHLLNPKAITWKYYSNGKGSLWTAPNAFLDICVPDGKTPPSCTGSAFQPGGQVVSELTLLGDLGFGGSSMADCQLPQMSWVIPDGSWSDHPGNVGADGGPSWVAAIVNAVGGFDNNGNKLPVQCGYWDNTAILVTWDDWGGFYDDVSPDPMSSSHLPHLGYQGTTNGEFYVYGFRVPLLVIAPYAKKGYISGANVFPPVCNNSTDYCHDFGSILNFVEYAFGTGGARLGTIGPSSFPYADFFVQDLGPSVAPGNSFSLHDFFDFSNKRAFTPITGAKYATSCFTNQLTTLPNAVSCFSTFPLAPDSDD
jgi:phospholipase C